MDPILQEIYSTVVPSAPFLIAAYALLWAALLVYVVVMQRGLKKSEKRLDLIEAELGRRAAAAEPPLEKASDSGK